MATKRIKETLIIEKLDELGYPYDDFVINYISKIEEEITKETVKSAWFLYVKEKLF